MSKVPYYISRRNMDAFNGQYADRASASALETLPFPGRMTLKGRLDMAVKEAEERLAEAKEAQEIFERNPDLERLLNIMQKGRF